MGSWCDTQTASCPAASARARCAAPSIRCAISRYGSPHDGVNGLRSNGQYSGLRSAPSPTPTCMPSKALPASISRSSVIGSTPSFSAIGTAVSCARCIGETSSAVTSAPARCSAARRACSRPVSESP